MAIKYLSASFNVKKVVEDLVEEEIQENVSDIISENLDLIEVKHPFTNLQDIQIDVTGIDNPDVSVYINSGSGNITLVKPSITLNTLTNMLEINFVSPKTGIIIIRSQ